ncbi:MAG: sugar transferase [Actinomycetota bacterium]|nr:sugar transferase [Actinomycetota bacterium]
MALLRSWSWFAWFHVCVALLILAASGFYRLRLQLSVLEHLPDLLVKLSSPSLIAVVAALSLGKSTPLLLQACLFPLAVMIFRAATSLLVRRLRAAGKLAEPVVVLGGGTIGGELIQQLQRHPEYGLAPIGYLDDEAAELDAFHVGRSEDLEDFIRNGVVRHVIVAFPSRAERELVGVLRLAKASGADLWIVPRFFDIGVTDGSLDEIWGIPLCSPRREPGRTACWGIKRAIDVALAGILLVSSGPLLAFGVLAVLLTSPGPVIFRQWRVGQNGRRFEILKLRSLRHGAESSARSDASRLPVTPVGSFLRRSKIDELPQFWNVLRGDMSLVGPRPEQPDLVDSFSETIPVYKDRHRLPVGITGLAQVNGVCGDCSHGAIKERARFDNRYIEQWTLWRDIAILLRTIPSILTKRESARSCMDAKIEEGDSNTLTASNITGETVRST